MRLLLLLIGAMTLTSCAAQSLNRAMDRNRCAIQRSTVAIEQNVEALNEVTQKLQAMEG